MSSKLDIKNQPPAQYPHRLSFYLSPPTFEATLEFFESTALTRLRLLSEIETCASRNRAFEDAKGRAKMMHNWACERGKRDEVEAERKGDNVGHFALRLAFCRSDELRDRFVRAETSLFKYRWETEDGKERDAFFRYLMENGLLPLEMVGAEEKEKVRDKLLLINGWMRNSPSEVLYKAPWNRIPELVSSRRLLISRGQAYLTSRDLPQLIFNVFSSLLSQSLLLCARALPSLSADTRLPPLLEHLETSFLSGGGEDYNFDFEGDKEEIRSEMVPGFVRDNSFPMCMRHLYDTLKKDGHLKHYARLQFGLFLKGIGLSIEDALRFWKTHFTRSDITGDKFEKEYKYNIRHSYGLEGRRMNYPPKSCQRIIMTDQPGTHDSHGCPFKHFDPTALGTALVRTYGLERSKEEHKEIVDASKNKLYHVACTRLFEVTHQMKKGDGMGGGEVVDHPNRWFVKSREIRKAREGEAMEVEIER
ncbi:DNA primase, large subunit [Atractiella rhizophila]|nr:DNA primase, large subunit [Atractiella rhizophila]